MSHFTRQYRRRKIPENIKPDNYSDNDDDNDNDNTSVFKTFPAPIRGAA